MSTAVKIILSFFVALIGQVIFVFVSGIDIATGFILALLLFIISIIALELPSFSDRLKKLESSNAKLLDIYSNIFKEGTTFTDYYNTLLISSIREKALSKGLVFSRDRVASVWLRNLEYIDKSLFVTSYIDPSEGWLSGFTQKGLEIQAAHIIKGRIIRRVFIVNSEEELNTVINIIKQQRAAGIDAKYVYKREIEEHSHMKNVKLDSYDFAIIDNVVLSFIKLNKRRKIQSLSMSRDEKELSRYSIFYERLYEEAKVPDESVH